MVPNFDLAEFQLQSPLEFQQAREHRWNKTISGSAFYKFSNFDLPNNLAVDFKIHSKEFFNAVITLKIALERNMFKSCPDISHLNNIKRGRLMESLITEKISSLINHPNTLKIDNTAFYFPSLNVSGTIDLLYINHHLKEIYVFELKAQSILYHDVKNNHLSQQQPLLKADHDQHPTIQHGLQQLVFYSWALNCVYNKKPSLKNGPYKINAYLIGQKNVDSDCNIIKIDHILHKIWLVGLKINYINDLLKKIKIVKSADSSLNYDNYKKIELLKNEYQQLLSSVDVRRFKFLQKEILALKKAFPCDSESIVELDHNHYLFHNKIWFERFATKNLINNLVLKNFNG